MSINLKFTPSEIASLQEVLDKLSFRSKQKVTLAKLIQDWDGFVSKVESGYTDSIYEYINDLSIRNLIQLVISESPPQLRSKIENLVSSMDKRFLSASDEAKKKMLSEETWWSSRVPKYLLGELKSDLFDSGYL